MSYTDVLAVPRAVRAAVAHVLPSSLFALYAISPHHAVAVTAEDERPYELYLAFTRDGVPSAPALAALVQTRGHHARLTHLLPPSADPALPICREVRTGGDITCAMDVLVPDSAEVPSFPFTANVMVFVEDDAHRVHFERPAQVALATRVCFE